MIYNYILSNESINSKGFIVLTNGIELQDFNDNPVLLHNHDINQVVGHWENVRINEQNSEELIGTAVFDYSDPKSQEIMNKVAKNLIKHVSIGIRILEFYEDIIDDQDVIVITKSELMEASVTPLPANKDAVKLYYKNDEVEDNLTFFTNKIKNKIMNSKLVELTNEVNDLRNQIKDNDVKFNETVSSNDSLKKDLELKDKEVEDLKSEIESLNTKLKEIDEAEATQKFNELLDSAIESNKIKEDQKENFLKLSFENAKTIIDGLESKNIKEPEVKLTDKIEKTEDKKEEKNIRWYEINDPESLKLMLKEDKERYDKLFNEFYN